MTIDEAREYVKAEEFDFYAVMMFDFYLELHPDADPAMVAEAVLTAYRRNHGD